ncbi:MAG TPA: diacylglycerol kinase family protein [Phycisphaerales bacterium]|nr:diacylglycerol kinase family protein [Phycisphaerales bacterium]
MTVALLHNSDSGRGQAARLLSAFEHALKTAAIETKSVRIERSELALEKALQSARALVVIGGDGSVRSALGPAMRAGVPIYHVPVGTENLFARHFGMSRRPDSFIGAYRAMRIAMVDVGVCAGKPFALMASTGPDASVVHRLAAARKGPITHASYVPHIFAELISPRLPLLTITVDGTRVVEGKPGVAVVANCPGYAMNLNPAHDACMEDGLLDVVFIPASSRLALLSWVVRGRLPSWRRDPSVLRRRAHRVRIDSTDPIAVQIDGDAADETHIDAEIQPGVVRVLLPVAYASQPRRGLRSARRAIGAPAGLAGGSETPGSSGATDVGSGARPVSGGARLAEEASGDRGRSSFESAASSIG